MQARTIFSIVAVLIALTGCASMQEAGDGSDPHTVPFLQVKAAPDSMKGQAVVFGGNVLTGRRLKDGTRIEILQLPLDRTSRPVHDLTKSQGRFIAFQSEFLDPATLPPGTRVTVTGEVSGSVTLPLDETDYTYPVINIKQLRVWAKSEDVAPHIRPYMGPGPYWGPYWGPYGRPWPYW
jgi:outer membrane lipoprotein